MAAMLRPAFVIGAMVPGAVSLALEPRGGSCDSASMDFSEFIEKYGRSYQVGTEEYDTRHAIFQERASRIASHNCEPAGPWTATINHLTDWTPAELKTLFGHRSMRHASKGQHLSLLELQPENRMKPKHKRRKRHKHKPVAESFPRNFSWGNLSAILANSSDQSTCGSCWAHAARVTMQARAEIKGKKKIHWSTNQLIACTPNAKHCGGEGGCEGATAELAYEYVLNNGLLQADEFTKQVGSPDQKVKCPAEHVASTEVATRGKSEPNGNEVHRVGADAKGLNGLWVGLTGWTKLAENKEEPILHELMNGGPLYVAVAAGDHWFDYQSGVMTEDGCDRDFVVNHAVVLFAWGVKEKTIRGPVKYWQIKNSWGPNWGESGTGRIIRSDNEEKVCGWDEDPQSGSGCDGGPERVWVCGTCGILYDAVAPHF